MANAHMLLVAASYGFIMELDYIYIYIYAFSRRFYPKRLTLHSSYSFFFTFDQLLLSLGIEPVILALLAPCSTIWATGKLELLDGKWPFAKSLIDTQSDRS